MLNKLLLLLILAAPCPAMAEALAPRPPRGQVPYLAYGAAVEAPSAAVWKGAELRKAGRQPSGCLRWTGDTKLVAALAGEFRSPLTLDALLVRLTAISVYPSIKYGPSIKYWSMSQQQRRPWHSRSALWRAPRDVPGEVT